MAELSKTVEIDGEEREVVYDPETDEWSLRRTVEDLKTSVLDADKTHNRNDRNTVGVTEMNWDTYRQYADQTNTPIGTAYVTVEDFVDFAKKMKEQFGDLSAVDLTVCDGLPLVAEKNGVEIVLVHRTRGGTRE